MLEEIKEKIAQFSREKKQFEMLNFLKEALTNKTVSPQELYDYSSRCHWQSKSAEKEYVIDAATINLLGVVISQLRISSDMTQQFYKLAADRGSNYGCCNYANTLYTESSHEALIYIRKAIELSAPTEQGEFQLLHARLLWKNNACLEANIALNVYLNYIKELYFKNKQAYLPDLKQGMEVCTVRLNAYQQALPSIVDPLHIEQYIAELTPFLTGYITYLDLYSEIASKAAYLKAQLHERLGQYSQAMQVYARVTDPQYCHYSDAIIARRQLMQVHVTHFLSPIQALADIDALAESASHLAMTHAVAPVISHGQPIYSQQWQSGTDRVDFVDVTELKRLYDEQVDPLWKRVREKQRAIEVLEKPFERLIKKPILAEVELLKEEITPIVKTCRIHEEQYANYSPEKREILRRHLAEKTFFAPNRTRKKTALLNLTTELVSQRYNQRDDNQAQPLDLTGVSARQLITAEAAFQHVTVELMALNKDSKSITLGIPTLRRAPWNFDDGFSGENTFGPVEAYRVGGTPICAEHRTDPKRQRLGSAYVRDVKTYDEIFEFLNDITQGEPEKEQVLAGYFIRYGNNHQPVTSAELRGINPFLGEQAVHGFNRICFLIMEKEQAQWHSATSESHQLGMAVSQARCMILLKEGVLRFVDVFKNCAKYGVYSQYKLVDYPSDVANACKEIDILYKKYLCRGVNMTSTFFKKTDQAEVEVSNPYVVLSRKQGRADLSYVYGGEGDSDGEGYDSDISFSSRGF